VRWLGSILGAIAEGDQDRVFFHPFGGVALFLDGGGEVGVYGVSATIDVYDVGCGRRWCCGWGAAVYQGSIRVGDGEDSAEKSSGLVRVDDWLA
jgi:hypothetical protein